MSVDLDAITALTVQLDALNKQATAMPPGPAKDLLTAQAGVVSAQLSAAAQHAQIRADSSSNMLDNLGLFATLQGAVGSVAPTIINLFKR